MSVRRSKKAPYKFISHSKTILKEAVRYGWLPAARYTNLRDVRHTNSVWFIDIDWKNYDFEKHLYVVKKTKPFLTIARDIETSCQLDSTIAEAEELGKHAKNVALVPKAIDLTDVMEAEVPECYIFGYSVPTRYGGTSIPIESFRRPVHLLGGRPDVQYELSKKCNVFSIDGNRFTLDAKYGDYFDGEKFRPHPEGGYLNCVRDSLKNINNLWDQEI